MDTSQDNMSEPTMALALQKLFYRMQFEKQAVDTKTLTKSFGWDSGEVFTQHDAQELSRVFIDTLEEKMKGTKLEGFFERMLRGKEVSVIECLNVPASSRKEEKFYDLSLNVKGCRSAFTSFQKYCEEEMLTGDDKYDAGTHGKQDAKKHVKFSELPPVLHLHLKRFTFNMQRYGYEKVNDYYSFPGVLRLDDFIDPAHKGVKQTYILHGVLVHSGGVNGGHYYAFIRPTLEKKWYKFNDELVTSVTKDQALNDNFGGVGGRWNFEKSSNAYMLIYIRKKERKMYLEPVTEADIPASLLARFQGEQIEAERKRKEREEEMMKRKIFIVTDALIKSNTGQGLACRPFNTTISVRRDDLIKDVRKQIEEATGIPVNRQRLWKWRRKQNATERIAKHPQGPSSLEKEVERVFHGFYVEEVPEQEVEDPSRGKDSWKLLFLKYYDPKTQTLRMVSKFHATPQTRVSEVAEYVRHAMDLDEGAPLNIVEEVDYDYFPSVRLESTMEESRLVSGDILVFSPPVSPVDNYKYPTTASYFKYLASLISITFKARNDPKAEPFVVQLSRRDHYDDILALLAQHFGVGAGFIRLAKEVPWATGVEAVDGARNPTLDFILPSRSTTLYYEVLEMDVEELKNKREITVSFRDRKAVVVGEKHTIWVPKNATGQDVISALQSVMEIPFETVSKRLRLVCVKSNKLSTVDPQELLPPATPAHYHNLREWFVEEIADEEINAGAKDVTLVVVRYRKSAYISYGGMYGGGGYSYGGGYGGTQEVTITGTPFYFTFKNEETFGEAKKRMFAAMETSKGDFDGLSAVKFTTSHWGDKAKSLSDDEVISKGNRHGEIDFIGISDRAKKRVNQELKIQSK